MTPIIKRKLRIGIVFNFSQHWMGGIVYITNIIKTLNYLDDAEKPEIFFFYKTDLKKYVDEINYPYFVPVEWEFQDIVKGNIYSYIKRSNIFIDQILRNYQLDALFPLHDFPLKTKTNTKLIAWSADLQHKHYPEFFNWKQIWSRNIRMKQMIKNADALVVSSQSVLDDFTRFFKLRKELSIPIYHFVSVIDNTWNMGIDELKTKYKLPDSYFLVSNQFHRHKNHLIVLKSLVKLKQLGIRRHVVFTGKFPIDSNSPYLAELHRIIKENNLEDQISLLGIISRDEQLQIMKHSQAVIQPSLFEGWSTVIEDAKSLQVPVIASNINVNIEQLGNAGNYFQPNNPDELSIILKDFPARNLNDVFYGEYSKRLKEAAKTLMNIFSET